VPFTPDAVVFQGFCFGAPLQSMKVALHQNEAPSWAFLLKGLIGAARKRRRTLAQVDPLEFWRDRRGTAQLIEELRTSPGNWERSKSNLPLPMIDEQETSLVLHNNAIVQGLSELPFTQDVQHWGVLTIGTSLANARSRTAAERGMKLAQPSCTCGSYDPLQHLNSTELNGR
jgi:hypothetical protein